MRQLVEIKMLPTFRSDTIYEHRPFLRWKKISIRSKGCPQAQKDKTKRNGECEKGLVLTVDSNKQQSTADLTPIAILAPLFLITASLWVLLFRFETICFTGEAMVFAAHETGFRYPTRVCQETNEGQNGFPESNLSRLTPAQQYAGEILSYLLPVVLGQAGRLESRRAWQTKGLREELDFKNIVEVMTDVEKNELALMVLDPDILDLTRVLYYYDNRLRLYKGDFDVASIYPAPEFVAIRLLLLQKIHRGEKVDLKTLIKREEILFNQEAKPSPEDLNAMGLRSDELRLLRDLLEKEPHIYQYLKSPFLVKAFYKAVLRSVDWIGMSLWIKLSGKTYLFISKTKDRLSYIRKIPNG